MNYVLQKNVKINKKEEEEILKKLLRYDFVDDPALETDFDRPPIILPGGKWVYFLYKVLLLLKMVNDHKVLLKNQKSTSVSFPQ